MSYLIISYIIRCKKTLYDTSQGFIPGKPRNVHCPTRRAERREQTCPLCSQPGKPGFQLQPPTCQPVIWQVTSPPLSLSFLTHKSGYQSPTRPCFRAERSSRYEGPSTRLSSNCPVAPLPPLRVSRCVGLSAGRWSRPRTPLLGLLPHEPFYRYVRDLVRERETEISARYILQKLF